jgi:hypothetical protein
MKRKILWILGGVLCGLISVSILAAIAPEKRLRPELLAIGIIGCQEQDTAVAIARALSTHHVADSYSLSKWAEKNGCALVPAGTYVTPIEEEAGHKGITKVLVHGSEKYLLGLPRPTPREQLDIEIADLKRAIKGSK